MPDIPDGLTRGIDALGTWDLENRIEAIRAALQRARANAELVPVLEEALELAEERHRSLNGGTGTPPEG